MSKYLNFILFCNVAFITNLILIEAAYCPGKPSPSAQPNLNPIIDEKPLLVSEIKNAKLYTVGSGDDLIKIVHLWGTPYEMGYAHATIAMSEMYQFFAYVWTFIESQIKSSLNGNTEGFFKDEFLKLVADNGLELALEIESNKTEIYISNHFLEEIQGMADAAGIDPKAYKQFYMISELGKTSSSMFGAWGLAIPSVEGLLQLGAIDWGTDSGFQNVPQITVYHPNKDSSTNGHDFANIGWSGWIGSFQGYSSKKLAVSQIGVSYPDISFGEESLYGTPFTYVLRDILQFDSTFDDAFNRIKNAKRTSNLILGIGDGKINKFNSIQYSASVANCMDDTTLKPDADWHPKITNVVYHGVDWLCPSFNQVMAGQITKLYGNLTTENAIRDVTSIVQTGSLLVTYYDFENDVIYTANARGYEEEGPENAYERSFVKIKMNDLFSELPPNL
ncbi:unnamed protein product [Brachionus calyciflorus]|uniref:Uncharacterized protein n=1 Tax=Brachionus calyciflorus TaxID=104777 RepID=A0A813RTM6_9BILA|nr:unnamed protein product [Brachionus calyciflorus]